MQSAYPSYTHLLFEDRTLGELDAYYHENLLLVALCDTGPTSVKRLAKFVITHERGIEVDAECLRMHSIHKDSALKVRQCALIGAC